MYTNLEFLNLELNSRMCTKLEASLDCSPGLQLPCSSVGLPGRRQVLLMMYMLGEAGWLLAQAVRSGVCVKCLFGPNSVAALCSLHCPSAPARSTLPAHTTI